MPYNSVQNAAENVKKLEEVFCFKQAMSTTLDFVKIKLGGFEEVGDVFLF